MKKNGFFYILLFMIFISGSSYSQIKGHLFIIGGGDRPKYMMDKFIDLAGGKASKFIIIPMASSDPMESALEEKSEFKEIGCQNVDFIFCSKENADVDTNINKLKDVKGIFFSGGDQSRLTKVLLGTKLLEEIKRIYKNGGVIGGTSAGAAVMSKIMITGDEKINKDTVNLFKSIQKNNVIITEGFGFLDKVIIDQHFIKRKRNNRLISIVLENPKVVGIGIDESTAIITNSGNSFEVLGEGSVIIYDARKVKSIRTDKNGNIAGNNIIMHILISGDKYNLDKR